MPKVSILCIAYNQEKFILQTLESFVMQKTEFEFEVIIGEDCSSDNTKKIIKEFAQKYPGIIKPIYREKNIGAIQNFMDLFYQANGEYIALCEGDDFFTDDNKLQLQADFLDKNPEYYLCFHPVKVFFENKEKNDAVYPETKDSKKFTTAELLKKNFIQTNSVMYRKINYENLPVNIMPGDWYMHLYHAKFGKIGFIDKVMSAYRRHSAGLWWDSHNNREELYKKFGISHMNMYFELLKLYKNDAERKSIILDKIYNMTDRLAKIDHKYETNLIENVEYGQVASVIVLEMTELKKELQQKKNRNANILWAFKNPIHFLKKYIFKILKL